MDGYISKDIVITVIDNICNKCDHDDCYYKNGREYCPVMDVINSIKDLSGVDLGLL